MLRFLLDVPNWRVSQCRARVPQNRPCVVMRPAIHLRPMEERRVPISFRVSPRFKRCLVLAAEHEQRSQTNLIEKLVFDFCRQVGLDPDAHAAAPSQAPAPASAQAPASGKKGHR